MRFAASHEKGKKKCEHSQACISTEWQSPEWNWSLPFSLHVFSKCPHFPPFLLVFLTLKLNASCYLSSLLYLQFYYTCYHALSVWSTVMNLWLLCFSVKSELLQLHTLPIPPKAAGVFNMQTLDHFLLIPSAHYRLLEMGLECCIWCEMCGCPEMCVGEKLPLLVTPPPTKWSSGLNVVINSQQDFLENGSNIENRLLEAEPLHDFSRLVNIFVMVWLYLRSQQSPQEEQIIFFNLCHWN